MAPKAFLLYATLLLFLAIFPYTILSRQNPEPKPFDFLQHLEGCHKGQTIKGVNQLKQYLRRFGYLTSANLDGNDESDELLESGIKTCQLNYNLKATGTLDSQTIKQMKIPRCGFPDIQENGRTSMTSGKSNKKHHHDQKLLHTVSHYSFFPNSPRWPPSKTQLTYAFTSSSIPVVDIETLRSVCSKAFSKWAAVSGLSFVEVADQADIMIGFYRGDHVDDNNFDGPGRIAAHAFPPPDGRFHYDADENWSTNPRSEMSEIDLESVTVHEIGHLLGLGHSSVKTAVMSSTIGPGVIKRDLVADDIAGIIGLTRQALVKYANQIFLMCNPSLPVAQIKGVTFYSQHFLDLVNDMDTVLASHNGFLLELWLESSKQLVQDPEQEKQETSTGVTFYKLTMVPEQLFISDT